MKELPARFQDLVACFPPMLLNNFDHVLIVCDVKVLCFYEIDGELF